MQLNTKSIKSQFEKSMNKYDENAIVQCNMAKYLIANLIKINSNFESILELGSGTGVLTKEILNNMKFEKYVANDLVEKSKNYISKMIPNVEFIHGNALKINTNNKFDLIISNAMFQWFSNLDDILTKCKRQLKSDGILAFSTFGPNNFAEIKKISGLSLKYLSAIEIKDILLKDFEILLIEEYTKVLEFNNPLELLAHMKNTGVNSLSTKPWTVKDIKEFCEKYMEEYECVKLTYDPIIVIARTK